MTTSLVKAASIRAAWFATAVNATLWRFVLTAPAILLGFVASQPPAFAADPVVLSQGILLLQEGRKSEAYALLEKAFRAEETAAGKSSLAALLAVAPEKFLTHPKHLYSAFALENGKGLSIDDQVRLERIAGDGYFDAAQFPQAASYYHQTLTQKLPSQLQSPTRQQGAGSNTSSATTRALHDAQEYATYKLGWIHLNQHEPRLAFELWLKWRKTHSSDSTADAATSATGLPGGDLADSLLKDLSRAWIEAIALSPAQTPARFDLPLNQREQQTVLQGFTAALRREKKPNFKVVFSALEKTPHFGAFYQSLLTEFHFYRDAPCEAIAGFNRLRTENLDTALARTYLIDCASRPQNTLQTRTALAALFAKIPVTEQARLAKAEVFKQAAQLAPACNEYLNALQEYTAKAGEPLQSQDDAAQNGITPSLIRQIAETCLDSRSEASSSQMKRAVGLIFGSRQVADQNQKDFTQNPTKWTPVLATFFTKAAAKGLASEALIQNSSLWRKSLLPQLALEAADQDLKSTHDLLSAFKNDRSPETLNRFALGGIKTLLKAGQFDRARLWLGEYFPLESKPTLQAQRLWVIASQDQASAARGKVQQTWANTLFAQPSAQVSQEDRKALAGLLVEQGDWEAVQKHWSLLRHDFETSPQWAEAFATSRLRQQAGSNSPSTDSSPLMAYARSLVQLASDAPATPLATLPVLKKSPLHADALALHSLRQKEGEFQNLELPLGARFEKLVSRKLALLKSNLARATRHTWTQPLLLDAASRSFDRSRNSFAAALEKTASTEGTEPDIQIQLWELAQTLRSWTVKSKSEGTAG